MVNQAAVPFRLACVQRLLQCVEYEVRAHRAAHPPSHDAPGVHVNDKDHVQPALPGRNVGEIRDPELVRPVRFELAVEPVQRACGLGVAGFRAHDLAAHDTTQAQPAYQPLHDAARHDRALEHNCRQTFSAPYPVANNVGWCRARIPDVAGCHAVSDGAYLAIGAAVGG